MCCFVGTLPQWVSLSAKSFFLFLFSRGLRLLIVATLLTNVLLRGYTASVGVSFGANYPPSQWLPRGVSLSVQITPRANGYLGGCLSWCQQSAPRETHTWVGSLKSQVSFAEYSLFYRALLQKRPIIWRSLPIIATKTRWILHLGLLSGGCACESVIHMYMWVYVCIYTYVYVYMCMYVCIHIQHASIIAPGFIVWGLCMWISDTYIHVSICMYIYICICVCIYVFIFSMPPSLHLGFLSGGCACESVIAIYMWVYVCTYTYVYVYMYMYICIHMYIHIQHASLIAHGLSVWGVCVRDARMLIPHCNTHCTCTHEYMRWLRSVGSIKLQVSFAEYRLFYRSHLQKRPVILSILLTVATPYLWIPQCVMEWLGLLGSLKL